MSERCNKESRSSDWFGQVAHDCILEPGHFGDHVTSGNPAIAWKSKDDQSSITTPYTQADMDKAQLEWQAAVIEAAAVAAEKSDRYGTSCLTIAARIRALTTADIAAARERMIADALGKLVNMPETEDFDRGVPLESIHQIERWGSEHDDGKQPEDWFWLIGYLAGKALAASKSGDLQKAKHHCISTAAVLRNWHKNLVTGKTEMRPGIMEPK